MSPRGLGGKNKEEIESKEKKERGKRKRDMKLDREFGEMEKNGGDNINIKGKMKRIEPLNIKSNVGNVGTIGGGPPGLGGSRVHFGIPMSDKVYFSHWDILTPDARITALWFWDNLKLRCQRAFVERYLPTRKIWKKKKIKRDIELIFEDIDEEIYFEEQFKKKVKQTEEQKKKAGEMARKALDDWEEALAGYDKFTVEEEKKIKKMFAERMKQLTRIQKAERIP